MSKWDIIRELVIPPIILLTLICLFWYVDWTCGLLLLVACGSFLLQGLEKTNERD